MESMQHSPKGTTPAQTGDLLRQWIDRHQRLFVLTGAGCSTDSGIPDYRDREGAWKRTPPVTIQAFTGDAATYRRYWARSWVGWPRIATAQPNTVHHVLAEWESGGRLSALLTQNVDGLHQRAGCQAVIDLHGRIDAVICLDCGASLPRSDLQLVMETANPDWRMPDSRIAPDGDADIDPARISGFLPPRCDDCRGMLKPDVVFFGEYVPRARVDAACRALSSSDALLVIGSSLMVYSGFRFARMAGESGMPIAILNRGRTRADTIADLKLDADAGATLLAASQQSQAPRSDQRLENSPR